MTNHVATARRSSMSPAHWREDLSASLDLVTDPTNTDHATAAAKILGSVAADTHPCVQFEQVLAAFGAKALGAVLRFHLEAETSLEGPATTMIAKESLARLDLTVRDLEWPEAVMHPHYIDQATSTDPVFEAKLAAAKQQHAQRLAEPEQPEERPAAATVTRKPNGSLEVTDALGRTATLHWSRFQGLIVSAESAVYLGQPEVTAWLLERLVDEPEEPETPDACTCGPSIQLGVGTKILVPGLPWKEVGEIRKKRYGNAQIRLDEAGAAPVFVQVDVRPRRSRTRGH